MINKEYSDILPEKNSNVENFNQFNLNNFQKLNNKKISSLVSELFNHINSRESLNYISDLLITSFGEYKKKYPIEGYIENKDFFFKGTFNNNIKDSHYTLKNSREECLAISNDIHLILSNNSELTNMQKLDFCNNQRYFMKLYLKELLIKINKT